MQALWAEANRAAHESLLEVLDGGGKTVSTEGGQVTLDLGSLLTQVGEQIGVGDAIASKVPPEAGQLTILESDQISTAQSVAKGIRGLPIVLTLLVLLLYGLAIYLAGPRRRQALRSAGLGFVAAGILALLLRGLAGDRGGRRADRERSRQAGGRSGLGNRHLTAGHRRRLGDRLRRARLPRRLAGRSDQAGDGPAPPAAPYLRAQPGAAAVVALAVFVALIAWAPVAAFHKPLGFLLFAILFAAGAEILRRQTLREFSGRPAAVAAERLSTQTKGVD